MPKDYFIKKRKDEEQQEVVKPAASSTSNTGSTSGLTKWQSDAARRRSDSITGRTTATPMQRGGQSRQRKESLYNTARDFMTMTDAAYIRGDWNPRSYLSAYQNIQNTIQNNKNTKGSPQYMALSQVLKKQRDRLMPDLAKAENIRNNPGEQKLTSTQKNGMTETLDGKTMNANAYRDLLNARNQEALRFNPQRPFQTPGLFNEKPVDVASMQERYDMWRAGKGDTQDKTYGDLKRMEAQANWYNNHKVDSFNTNYAPDQTQAEMKANAPGKDDGRSYEERKIELMATRGMSEEEADNYLQNEPLTDYTPKQPSELASDDLFSNALNSVRNEMKNRDFQREYSGLFLNKDFDKNSQFQLKPIHGFNPNDIEGTRQHLTEDDRDALFYNSVNGDQASYDFLHTRQNEQGDNLQYSNAMDKYSSGAEKYMTADEVQMFNYLYNTSGKEAAMKFYDQLLENGLNERLYNAINQEYEDWTREDPFMANVATTLTKPFVGIASTLSQGIDLATGNIDPYDPKYAYYGGVNTVRGTTGEMLRDLAGGSGLGADLLEMGYQALTSAVDNVYDVALGRGVVGKIFGMTGDAANRAGEAVVLGLMSTDAAQTSTLENLRAGMNETDAVLNGAVSGTIEYLTEKIGLDNLFDFMSGGKTEFISFLGKQFLAEGSEELLSNQLNNVWGLLYDRLAGYDVSDLKRRVNAYILENGLAPNDTGKAVAAILNEQMVEDAKAFAIGGLSAIGLGGYGTINNIRAQAANNSNAKALANDYAQLWGMDFNDPDTVNSIIEEAKTFDRSTATFKKAARLQTLEDKARGSWDPADVQDLYQTMVKDEMNGADRAAPSLSNALRVMSERANEPAPVRPQTAFPMRENVTPQEARNRQEVVNEFADNFDRNGSPAMGETIKRFYSTGIPVRNYVMEMNSIYNAVVQNEEIPDTPTLTEQQREAAQIAAEADRNRMQTAQTEPLQNRPRRSSAAPMTESSATAENTEYAEERTRETTFTKEYTPIEKTDEEIGADMDRVYDFAERVDGSYQTVFNTIMENYADDMDADAYMDGVEAITEQAQEGVAPEDITLPRSASRFINDTVKDAIYNAVTQEENYVRKGNISVSSRSEWNGSQSSGIESGSVEEGTGQTEIARNNTGRIGKPEVRNAFTPTGETATAESLGIVGGTAQDSVQIVDLDDSAENKQLKELASRFGKKIVAFAGSNLSVNGGQARGAIQGDTIYVRADHLNYSALQIGKHEIMHGELRNQTNHKINQVMGQLRTIFGDEFINNRLVPAYKKLFSGTGMTEMEIMEEILCDIYGEMNIWNMKDLPGMEETYNRFLSEGAKITYQTATSDNETAEAVEEVRNNGPPAKKIQPRLHTEAEAESSKGNLSDAEFSLEFAPDIAQRQIKYFENPKNNILFDNDLLQKALDKTNQMVAEMVKHQDILPTDKVGKVLVKNGSYDVSVENTTICLRTLAYNQFVDMVQDKLDRPLTQMESFLVSQKLYDIAVDPQCLYCYVSLDRKAYNEFLGRYIDDRDSAIKAYEQSGKPDVKGIKINNGKVVSTGEASQLFDEFLNGRKATDNMLARYRSWVTAYNNGAHLLSKSDIKTDLKRAEIVQKGDAVAIAQLKDILAYAQSASWSKKQMDYVAYNGEILKMGPRTVKNLNDHYGLRFYSFSDYSGAFIVENMQEVMDASLKGLKGLAYTKDVDFARIFADTGMNINISVFAKYNPETEQYEIDPLQSADLNDAIALRNEKLNVGIVAVATDADGVRWAMHQEWSDVVIPFHTVRTGKDVADFYKWTVFTGSQNDVVDPNKQNLWDEYVNSTGKSPKKVSKMIYPSEHNNDYDTYIRLIEERGLTPRFNEFRFDENGNVDPTYMKLVNETRQSAADTSPMVPNFNLDAAQDSFGKFVDKGGYYGGWYNDGVNVDAEAQTVADDITAGKTAKDVDYGRQDVNYEDLAKKRKQNRQHSKLSLETDETTTKYSFITNANMEDVASGLRQKVDKISTNKKYQPLSDAAVKKMVNSWIREYSSTVDADTFTKDVKNLINYLATSGNTNKFDVANNVCAEIAQKIVKNAKAVVAWDGSEIMKDIRTTKIKVSPRVSADIADWNEWRKAHFGKMRLSTSSGMDVTEVYQELADKYGESTFPSDINTATDQLLYLADFVDNYQPMTDNPFSYDMAEAIQGAALDIYNDIVNVDVLKSLSELVEDDKRYTDKIETLKEENRQRVKDVRKKARENRDKQIAKIKEHNREVRERTKVRKEDRDARKMLLKIAQRLDRIKTTAANRELIRELLGDLDLVALTLTEGKASNLRDLSSWYDAEKERNKDFVTRDDLIGKQIARLSQKQIGGRKKSLGVFATMEDAKKEYDKYFNEHTETADDFRLNITRKGQGRYEVTVTTDIMNIEDVIALTNMMKALETTIRTEKKLIGVEDNRDTFQLGMEINNDIDNAPGTKQGFWRNLDTFLVQGTLSGTRFTHRLTGYVESDPLYQAVAGENGLAGGQRKMLDYQRRAGELFTEWLSDKKFMRNLTGSKAQLIDYTVNTADGKTKNIQLTPAMRMTLYLASKDQGWMEHMCGRDTPNGHVSGGGITLPDMRSYKKGNLSDAYRSNTTKVRVTKSFLNQLASDMTAQEKAFADAIHDYFNGMSKDALNATSEQLIGYSIAQVGDYLPISVDKNFLDAEYGALKFDGTIEGMGNLKARQSSKKPVIVRDITDILKQSIESTSKYVGLAIPIRNINKLLGVSFGYVDSNNQYQGFEGSVIETINNKWGDRALKYIEKMITDLQTPNNNQEDLEKMFAKVRSKYAGAVLTLNLSVAMKQAASYPTAAAVLGWAPLVKAFSDNGHVDLNLIAKYTPLQWYRTQGFSTSELGDIKNQNNFFANLPKGLNWIQGVDLLTTRKLWKAAEFYVRDNNPELYNKGAGAKGQSDAYYKAVADIYNQVIEETQPNYTSLQRPEYLRSRSGVVQTLMMFKTQPMQNFNILYDSIGNFKAKKTQLTNDPDSAEAQAQYKEASKKLRNAITSQIGQLITFAAMTMLWNVLRRKKEKYTDDEGNVSLKAIASSMGKDIGSGVFGMLPFGSDVWSLISSKVFGDKYYGFESVTDSAIGDLGSAVSTAWDTISKLLTSEEGVTFDSLKKKIKNVASSVSKMFGVPFDNVYNTITALYMRGQDVFNNKYLADYYAFAWTDDPAANRKAVLRFASAAYDNEDTEAYDALMEIFRDDLGFTDEDIDKSMREIYTEKYAVDPKNPLVADAYAHLYDLYKTDQDAYLKEYNTMIDYGFSDSQIKTGIEGQMKLEQGVDKVTDLEERFQTPQALEERAEAMKPLHETTLFKNAKDADKEKLEGYMDQYLKEKPTEAWARGKEGVDAGAISLEEYMKFRLVLDSVDKPTDSGNYGSYTKDEVVEAIKKIGWSDAKAKELWQYLPNTSKNPYDPNAKTSKKDPTPVDLNEKKKATAEATAEAKAKKEAEEEAKKPKSGTLQSSWLSGYYYDPETGELQVQANGRWYTHYVSQDIFDAFMAAGSKGSYYSRVIKYY